MDGTGGECPGALAALRSTLGFGVFQHKLLLNNSQRLEDLLIKLQRLAEGAFFKS